MKIKAPALILSLALVIQPGLATAQADFVEDVGGGIISDFAELIGVSDPTGLADLGQAALMMKALNEVLGMARQAKRAVDSIYDYDFEMLRDDALEGFRRIKEFREFEDASRELYGNADAVYQDRFWQYYDSGDRTGGRVLRTMAQVEAANSMQALLFPEGIDESRDFGHTRAQALMLKKKKAAGLAYREAREKTALAEILAAAAGAHTFLSKKDEASYADIAATRTALFAGKTVGELMSIRTLLEAQAVEDQQNAEVRKMLQRIDEEIKARGGETNDLLVAPPMTGIEPVRE